MIVIGNIHIYIVTIIYVYMVYFSGIPYI